MSRWFTARGPGGRVAIRVAFGIVALCAARAPLTGQCGPSREYIRLGGRVVAIESAGPTVSTASLPAGSVGTQYSQQLTATGGVGPYTWAVTTGSLPSGLNLPADTIAGSPTAAGTTPFTVTATDSCGRPGSKALSITIGAPVIQITTTSPLPAGTVGSAYQQDLAASGASAAAQWTLQSGTLPQGLALSNLPNGAGRISGTPTDPVQPANFTIKVTDGANTASKAFVLTINPVVLTIVTATLPDGMVSSAYSQTVNASGGSGTRTWSVDSGTLPAGLQLNPQANGSLVISGTPTSAAQPANFTLRVVDSSGSATRAFTPTIWPALTVTTASLPTGTVAVAYSATLQASGGNGSYSWSYTGSLPTGLSLNTVTGAITGSPSAGGSFSFTVTVTDTGGRTASRALSISVGAGSLTIVTPSPLSSGSKNLSYQTTIQASGGTAGYFWNVVIGLGNLPPGLSLTNPCTANSCTITGVPSQPGDFTFTIRISDSGNPQQAATKQFTIRILDAMLITAFPQPMVQAGHVSGLWASQPVTWSITPPTGSGYVGPTSSSTGIYQAPLGITSTQSATVTGTGIGGNYSVALTAMPDPTLTPNSGSPINTGQLTTFAVKGFSLDNWQGAYEFVEMVFNASASNIQAGPLCQIKYYPYTQTIYVDDGQTWSSRSLQSSEILATNRCAIGPGATEVRNGTSLTFSVPVAFTSTFLGSHAEWGSYSNCDPYACDAYTGSFTVASQASSVTVAPTTASLSPNGSQQFTPTVTGQPTTAVTWSVTPQAGTVTSGGLYTAPSVISVTDAAAQSVAVKATSQWDPAKSATAAVSLLPTDIRLTTTPSLSLYRAVNSITADTNCLVNGAASVTLAAGSVIRLQPGFTATAGSAATTFRAMIDPTIH